MKANETQVGGDHYKTGYEHWDLVLRTGMGYLEGNATKYVARHRKKGGVEDLQKGLHYVDKLLEALQGNLVRSSSDLYDEESKRLQVTSFATVNGLNRSELVFCWLLASWKSDVDLEEARIVIKGLIEEIRASWTAPATDSNKHGDRA